VSRARHPLPTDLVALITHDGKVYPNEAKTWDRMGADDKGPHPLGTALEQWLSFATGKHTWVSVSGATIRGLVSARRRGKRSAWEVDSLIAADDDPAVTVSLLERMSSGVGGQGAERVFLRVAADSAIVEVAREVGFFTYEKETLYRADDPFPVDDSELPLRPATSADAYGIYQLYEAVAPANVRAIEGATFREWQAAREPWGGNPSDLVLEEDGIITGWIGTLKSPEGRFALMVHPDRRDEEDFAAAALATLRGVRPVLCLVPAYAVSLHSLLPRLGFSAVAQYTAMAKRLVKPAEELTPQAVRRAVTAS
jgi:hypothetical protein